MGNFVELMNFQALANYITFWKLVTWNFTLYVWKSAPRKSDLEWTAMELLTLANKTVWSSYQTVQGEGYILILIIHPKKN